MALFLSVELGDQVRIGNSTIAFEQKTGRRIRLRIESTEDVAHEKAGDRTDPVAELATERPSPRLTRPIQTNTTPR